MGSFNTTCFLSQQTINTDDSVIIFPIKQQKSFHSFDLIYSRANKETSKFGYSNNNCYLNSFWDFSGPFLKGKYIDMGSFELEKTRENALNLYLFLCYLKKNLCIVKEKSGKNNGFNFSDSFDPQKQYNFDNLTSIFNKVWDIYNKDSLFVSHYDAEPVSLSFSVMHKASFDYLINYISQSKNHDGQSYEQKSYFNYYLNRELKFLKEVFPEKPMVDIADHFSISSSNLNDFNIGVTGSTHINIYYMGNPKTREMMKNYLLEGHSEISKEFSDEFFNHFKTHIEHRYISEALNDFGVRLSPMVYTPGDYKNNMGNNYLDMIKSINKEVNAIVHEKYSEDEYRSVKPK